MSHGPAPAPRALGFADAVRLALRRALTLSGRAARAEFWWVALAFAGLAVLLIAVNTVLFGPLVVTGPEGTRVIYGVGRWGGLVLLVALLPLVAVGCRRLHDTGWSGWWLLAPVALQFLLVWGSALLALGPARLVEMMRAPGGASFQITGALATAFVILILAAWARLILRLARPGDAGPNRFGPNPLEVIP